MFEVLGGMFGTATIGAAAGVFVVSLPAEISAGASSLLQKLCGCFVAGTLVDTPTGLVPIERIKVGDLVKSRDATNNIAASKPVIFLIRRHHRAIYNVRLALERNTKAEDFQVTDDHPWMSKDGHWLTTLQLHAGDNLQTENGRGVMVLAVTATSRVADTYKLDVADAHTYFVGRTRVWVHNACTPGQLAQYTRQLAVAGRESLLKSQASLEGRLTEHEAKLAQYLKDGGYTSSVEKEIRN